MMYSFVEKVVTSLLVLNVVVIGMETEGFDFGTIKLSSLKLMGEAHYRNGSVRLTRDLAVPNSGAGKVIYAEPMRLKHPASFTTFFTFSVSNLNPSSIGAGLAFVISPYDDFVGDSGPFLGAMYANGSLKTSVVAVEFDTLMDVEFNDLNSNHVGLDLGSMISAQASDLDAIGVDLKSGNQVNSWIDYSGFSRCLNISVSYSNLKPQIPILSIDVNLDEYFQEFMFVGFSGSTQGSTEIHSIDWWSFTSSFDTVPIAPAKSFDFNASPPPPPPTGHTEHSAPPSVAPSGTTLDEKEGGFSKCHKQLCKRGPGAVVGVVTASAFVLAVFTLVLIFIYSKRFRGVGQQETLASDVIKMPKEFSYKDLKIATKGFSSTRIIGYGAFGTVYKGILPENGDLVAVKRCSHNGQGKTEFISELSIIGTLRHRNLVRLQGWCHEKGEILLVYDLMPNGSLDKALFESRMVLPWQHRHKVLLGVASALTYLHQECENQVIHRDIKASNIMLDEGFNARLGDFGLARQVEHDKSPDATVAAGTMGYLAPEYLLTGRATEKTDVFSYGAVVLEVASGRRPIEKETEVGKVGVSSNLVEWVWGLHRDRNVMIAADPKLQGQFDEAEMRRVLLVGLACSHPDPLARPSMRSVVHMLVGEAEVPIVPRAKPSLSFSTSHLLLSLQDSVSDLNGMITISTSSSEECFTGGGPNLV
ncbi:hypothetical protein LIER_05331 [Lithospermum erythrorhizon]|uniref:non-specific serine/threonine protein kinase n=1 Tax=Lithospermum erythrorhizon TaxID=34254 RepID=A0AAV3P503_LITER